MGGGAAAVRVTGRPSAALEMTRSELLHADPEIGLTAVAVAASARGVAGGPAVVAAVGVCGGAWSRVNVLSSDVSGDVLWLLC